eukprot:scaffold517_cov119-Cylindrotheca_fusiformis.AAC.38
MDRTSPDFKQWLPFKSSCRGIFVDCSIRTEFGVATKADEEDVGGVWTADAGLETSVHYVSTV